MVLQFDHVGMVTGQPQENESWVEESQCRVSNPRLHPERIEYIRPKEKPEVDPDDIPLTPLKGGIMEVLESTTHGLPDRQP